MMVPSLYQEDAFAKMSMPLSPAEIVRTASFEDIAAMLHSVSSGFKSSSTQNVRNIQPVDCDQVANLLDAVAERIEQLLAVISVHKEEA